MEDSANLEKLLGSKKKRINSRTKGNTFERKVAEILNKEFNTTEFMRTPGSGAFATTHKLPNHLLIGGDLITPSGFPFLIEAKKGYDFKIADLLNPKSKFMEIVDKLIKESTRFHKKPVLIFQQDRQNILCLCRTGENIPKTNKDVIFLNNYMILEINKFIDMVKFYYRS